MDYIDQSARGLLIGLLCGIIVFYVFHPRTPYPPWMLVPYDHPWSMIPVVVIVYYIFCWDSLIGILVSLIGLAIALDIHVFGLTYVQASRTSPKPTNSIVMEGQFKSVSSISGLPLANVEIRNDGIPSPHYPLTLEATMAQPGDPHPF